MRGTRQCGDGDVTKLCASAVIVSIASTVDILFLRCGKKKGGADDGVLFFFFFSRGH